MPNPVDTKEELVFAVFINALEPGQVAVSAELAREHLFRKEKRKKTNHFSVASYQISDDKTKNPSSLSFCDLDPGLRKLLEENEAPIVKRLEEFHTCISGLLCPPNCPNKSNVGKRRVVLHQRGG